MAEQSELLIGRMVFQWWVFCRLIAVLDIRSAIVFVNKPHRFPVVMVEFQGF